jgi:hypothetical protein
MDPQYLDEDGQIMAENSQVKVIERAQHVGNFALADGEAALRKANMKDGTATLPLNSESELAVLQGELLLTRRDPCAADHMPMGTTDDPGVPSVHVFTSLNGLNRLSPKDQFRVVAQGRTNPANNMVAGTVSGPITMGNTGTKYINSGDLLVAKWPRYVSRNGEKVPKVALPDRRTKFYPAIEPFNFDDIAEVFRCADKELDLAITKAMNGSGTSELATDLEDAKAFLDADAELANRRGQLANIDAGEIRKYFPFAKLSFFPYNHSDREDVSAVCPLSKYVNMRLAQLGAPGITPDMYTFANSRSLERHSEATSNGGGGAANGWLNANGATTAIVPVLEVNWKTIPLLCADYFAEQAALWDSMKIGRAEGNAAPGRRFNVHFGFKS